MKQIKFSKLACVALLVAFAFAQVGCIRGTKSGVVRVLDARGIEPISGAPVELAAEEKFGVVFLGLDENPQTGLTDSSGELKVEFVNKYGMKGVARHPDTGETVYFDVFATPLSKDVVEVRMSSPTGR